MGNIYFRCETVVDAVSILFAAVRVAKDLRRMNQTTFRHLEQRVSVILRQDLLPLEIRRDVSEQTGTQSITILPAS